MARKLKSDKWLFIATLALVCTSIVMVYSATAIVLAESGAYQYQYLLKQGTFALVGLALVLVIMRIDYRNYRQPAVIWTVVGVVVVALVVVLFGREVKGARRWLDLRALTLQPSELAKIAIIMFVAAILERRMDRINEPAYSLLPIGVVLGTVVGLILVQPDLGTAFSIAMIAAVMIFAAGISYRYIAIIGGMAIPFLGLLIYLKPYRLARMKAYLDPWADQYDGGYQAVQSMISVSVGGIFGRGLTDGLQKLFYLPEPHNDFIFAVVGEELGMIGTTVLLACFCIIAWRGMRTALRAPDRFGSFLAIGLTTMVAFQALFNISVVLGLLPTKGIPLPLVSYGGSSLLINLIGIGILLNVSQHASASQIVTTTMPQTADA